jgi:hypothetical protein
VKLSGGTILLLESLVRNFLEDPAHAAPRVGNDRWEWTPDQLRLAQTELECAWAELHAGAPAGRPAVSQPDADGCDLKPDPAAARTSADLMDAVRAFRAWAGNPSYRGMAAASGGRVGYTTLHAALQRNELPALYVIEAIISGCRGDFSDVAGFVSAWRRLTMPPRSPRLAVAS